MKEDEMREVGGEEGSERAGAGACIPAETGGGARPPEGARPPMVAGYMPGEERGAGELVGHFFSRRGEVETHRRHLPHWGQDGTLCFVTFRLADSLPAEKLAEWKADREVWLKRHPEPWGEEEWREYLARFPNRLERWLDAGHGACILREEAARRCMDGVFARSDGGRCRLHAYVVMPNHVHVLFELRAREDLPELLQEWKGVSAHLLNRELGRTGRVWQEEYHDRLVRSLEHYRRAVGYIRKNWESWRGGREERDGRGRPSSEGGNIGGTGASPVANGLREENCNVQGDGRTNAMTGEGACFPNKTGEGVRPLRERLSPKNK